MEGYYKKRAACVCTRWRTQTMLSNRQAKDVVPALSRKPEPRSPQQSRTTHHPAVGTKAWTVLDQNECHARACAFTQLRTGLLQVAAGTRRITTHPGCTPTCWNTIHFFGSPSLIKYPPGEPSKHTAPVLAAASVSMTFCHSEDANTDDANNSVRIASILI